MKSCMDFVFSYFVQVFLWLLPLWYILIVREMWLWNWPAQVKPSWSFPKVSRFPFPASCSCHCPFLCHKARVMANQGSPPPTIAYVYTMQAVLNPDQACEYSFLTKKAEHLHPLFKQKLSQNETPGDKEPTNSESIKVYILYFRSYTLSGSSGIADTRQGYCHLLPLPQLEVGKWLWIFLLCFER